MPQIEALASPPKGEGLEVGVAVDDHVLNRDGGPRVMGKHRLEVRDGIGWTCLPKAVRE